MQSVVIVLPTLGKDLNIPDSRQQWVVSAYSLTFGCFLVGSFRLIVDQILISDLAALGSAGRRIWKTTDLYMGLCVAHCDLGRRSICYQ